MNLSKDSYLIKKNLLDLEHQKNINDQNVVLVSIFAYCGAFLIYWISQDSFSYSFTQLTNMFVLSSVYLYCMLLYLYTLKKQRVTILVLIRKLSKE